tara:strand:+ start:83 stop:646 length:564 start_codon:yes stop_codon:yes gene_type:complete
MPDFSKGLIYTIRTGNSVYVGSTTNFTERKCRHKSNIYNEICKHYNFKVYKTIRENDYEWSMKPYKEYPCKYKLQLQIEEERIRGELNADLNSQSCGTGLTKSEKRKQYYTDGKEKISEQQKKYRINSKEKIREQQKKYRINNKDKINEKQKQKVKCECGCVVSKCGLSSHKKTKKHLDCMEIINSD